MSTTVDASTSNNWSTKAIQLGSFNYSASAVDKNAKNVLLLDVPGITTQYAT